jgi:mevalonate kinase
LQRPETYHSKILLFGEYSILLGSSALSIPYWHFSAGLSFIGEDRYTDLDLALESNTMLKALHHHYSGNPDSFSVILDLDRFGNDIASGLYLESNIPQGYGLGSSGALCAALYARYARNRIHASGRIKKVEIIRLKEIFGEMESFFHGRSSGFDPLVIYLRFPLQIGSEGVPSIVGMPRNRKDTAGGIFLLDTGMAGKTGPLVNLFLEKFAPGGAAETEGSRLCELNNTCISHFLTGSVDAFWSELKTLSGFQLNGFQSMIPQHMRSVWQEGLDTGLFYLKLCGSGGGGFLTGFAPDYWKVNAHFRQQNMHIVPVYLAAFERSDNK